MPPPKEQPVRVWPGCQTCSAPCESPSCREYHEMGVYVHHQHVVVVGDGVGALFRAGAGE